MAALRRLGGPHQRAYDEACRIISSLSIGGYEDNKLTKHGESRIKHCIKYDISNDAHRLVTVQTNKYIYLLFVGTHDQTEKWLGRNRGLSVSLNKKSGKLTITHETIDNRRDTPQVDWSKMTEDNLPYVERIKFDPSEIITMKSLVRAINRINDNSSEDEINELIEDLEDVDILHANLILDVLFAVREGNLNSAIARIELFHEEAIELTANSEAEDAAIRDVVNSDSIAVLTGMSEEEVKDLFSPERFHEWMLFLHPDQKKVVELDYPGHAVLTGVSGSGKTCILVHRAVRLAKQFPERIIGVLTLNRSLTRLIDNQIKELCNLEHLSLPNIKVMACYDYFASIVQHFGPEEELKQLVLETLTHTEAKHIQKSISQVNYELYARDFDPLSGESLEDTWNIFKAQPYVRTLISYFQTHLQKLDGGVDPYKYLHEEFSFIRSAIPTKGRSVAYAKLKRLGRSIPLQAKERKGVLELLALYEETMMAGGILDDLSLTQTILPHFMELNKLPDHLALDHILIDEFQDLSTGELSILRRIPRQEENSMMIVGDTVQRVMVKDLRLNAIGLDKLSAHWVSITKNYRNSKQILKAASHLSNTYGALAKSSGQELEVLDPELAVRETASPIIAKSQHEIKDAWEYAQSCIQANTVAPWSICIVTAAPESISVNQIYRSAPESLAKNITRLNGDFKRQRDSVCVSNMSDVKGFDFSLVIIIGCGSKMLPPKGHCAKERWRDALRLYVAMTRARDAVRITYTGKPSEFLTCMKEDVTWEEQEKEAALPV